MAKKRIKYQVAVKDATTGNIVDWVCREGVSTMHREFSTKTFNPKMMLAGFKRRHYWAHVDKNFRFEIIPCGVGV